MTLQMNLKIYSSKNILFIYTLEWPNQTRRFLPSCPSNSQDCKVRYFIFSIGPMLKCRAKSTCWSAQLIGKSAKNELLKI